MKIRTFQIHIPDEEENWHDESLLLIGTYGYTNTAITDRTIHLI